MTESAGGCHCRQIRFRVRSAPTRVLVCDCSICTMKAYLHWIVPRDDFELLTDDDLLSTYRFNTRTARHYFCPSCGVAPFYIARSDPDKIDVNARCLDAIDLAKLELEPFNGANWEAHFEVYKKTR